MRFIQHVSDEVFVWQVGGMINKCVRFRRLYLCDALDGDANRIHRDAVQVNKAAQHWSAVRQGQLELVWVSL